LLGLVGVCLGFAVQILLMPGRPQTGNAVTDPWVLIQSNIFGAVPFVAVAMGLTVWVWTSKGAPFHPAWLLPAFLCLLVGGLDAIQSFTNPGPKGTWFQLSVVLPYSIVRPLLAGALGGAAMQLVDRRTT
jgi:hypothetical protein